MVNLLDKRYLIRLCYNFCKNGAVCKKSQEIIEGLYSFQVTGYMPIMQVS